MKPSLSRVRSRFSALLALSVTAVAASLLVFSADPAWPAQASDQPVAVPETYEVAEVLTGDTFKLTTGSVVTYSSIAAPPLQHKEPRVREYGRQALEFNRALLQGRKIRVEFGSQIKNADGVYQAFVFLEDGTFANLRMIEAGYAKLAIVPPNLQYAELLRSASTRARREGEGLWEFENKVVRRFQFVGDQMTKKYHFEGCRLIADLPKAHQQRFQSSVDAKAAGYHFCKECRHLYAQETDLF